MGLMIMARKLLGEGKTKAEVALEMGVSLLWLRAMVESDAFRVFQGGAGE
jgi:hypothetical protein